MIVRLSKFAVCLMLGAFASVVAFDNVIDYGTNYAFVQHVLSMDTTLPGNKLMDRALTSPALWQVAYGLIIACEAAVGLLFLVGAVALWRARRASGLAFDRAKVWATAAASAGLLLWFFGFLVVGGEWFAMWESHIWNGQEAAFRLAVIMLGALIYLNQPDRDLAWRGQGSGVRAPRTPMEPIP